MFNDEVSQQIKKLKLLRKGQVITGRWEGNRYKVLRHIGCGGSGTVYLAEDGTGALKALKVSPDLFGLTSEYRVLVFLRSCDELQNLNVVPEVYEIDDFQINSQIYHFIVMEYCHGKNLGQFKGYISLKDAAVVGNRLACFLDCLHRAGFVFGDLKPGNIIYSFETGRLHVIDYGSVTVKGGRLRQFTPGYDRATWQAGARIADERYDIFSLGMLLATLILGTIRRRRYDNPGIMTTEISGRIRNPAMREAVKKALTQDAGDCREIVSHLSDITLGSEPLKDGINCISSVFSKLLSYNFYGLGRKE